MAMKVLTVVLIITSFLIGHEYGVSVVAKECRLFGEFVNGKLTNGDYEVYKCKPDFDPALRRSK
jgi:hypothetical protein